MARETRAIWAKRVEQWKRSGLTGAAFAERIGVKEATLRHWKWQLDREGAATPAFVEVTPAAVAIATDANASSLKVEVGELRVVVPIGFDEETFRRLLRVVEGE